MPCWTESYVHRGNPSLVTSHRHCVVTMSQEEDDSSRCISSPSATTMNHLTSCYGSRHAHHTGEESEVLAAPEPLSSLPMAVIYRDVWRRHERSEMWRLTPTTTTVETRAREIVITHMLAPPSLLTSNHHPLRFPPAMLLPFCVSILCPWWLRT